MTLIYRIIIMAVSNENTVCTQGCRIYVTSQARQTPKIATYLLSLQAFQPILCLLLTKNNERSTILIEYERHGLMTCRELFSGFCSTCTKARPLLFAWRALSDDLSSRVAVGEKCSMQISFN